MRWACVPTVLLSVTAALAADVTKPAGVAGLLADRNGADVALSWTAVAQDALGAPETIAEYRIYRGTTPSFVADLVNGTNRVGTAAGTTFNDLGAIGGVDSYYYRVTARDLAGNESAAAAPAVTTPPTLTTGWTDTAITLAWSGAAPSANVAGFAVYYGRGPRSYETRVDVGNVASYNLLGLQLETAYYVAVVAYDAAGIESAFSNEGVEGVAGRVTVRAHNADYLCWGAAKCPPRAGTIQRADGWQLNVPVDFPAGDWKRVTVTYTIDSRLCVNGQNGTTNKCGDTNPGGYNPCGDPWDRIANLYLVTDEACLTNGQSCIQPANLELMRAITPFGTDAAPPLGSGVVPPRVLTLDVTPFEPLLSGRKYVGAEIGHFVQAGWWVTVDFKMSKRPEEASAKKPADGITVVHFGGAPMTPPRNVTIPADAQVVKIRLFTTGHGGSQYCNGGSNNGGACTSSTQCPGGSCQACDEFCQRNNRILKNGAPIWQAVPWRTDCSPGSVVACQGWNACGWPSCTFSRAGWCPGYIACHSNAGGGCNQDIDLTSQFTPGQSADVGYDVEVMRGGWQVSMALYWYRTP